MPERMTRYIRGNEVKGSKKEGKEGVAGLINNRPFDAIGYKAH